MLHDDAARKIWRDLRVVVRALASRSQPELGPAIDPEPGQRCCRFPIQFCLPISPTFRKTLLGSVFLALTGGEALYASLCAAWRTYEPS